MSNAIRVALEAARTEIAWCGCCHGHGEAVIAQIDAALAATPQAEPRRPQDWLAPMDERCYECRCATCKKIYLGHKRTATCRLCASPVQAVPEVGPVALPTPDGYVAMTETGSILVPPQEYRAANCYAIFTAEQMRQFASDSIAAAPKGQE